MNKLQVDLLIIMAADYSVWLYKVCVYFMRFLLDEVSLVSGGSTGKSPSIMGTSMRERIQARLKSKMVSSSWFACSANKFNST